MPSTRKYLLFKKQDINEQNNKVIIPTTVLFKTDKNKNNNNENTNNNNSQLMFIESVLYCRYCSNYFPSTMWFDFPTTQWDMKVLSFFQLRMWNFKSLPELVKVKWLVRSRSWFKYKADPRDYILFVSCYGSGYCLLFTLELGIHFFIS